MNKNLIPARSVIPGKILLRELDFRGWTQKDLAEIMNRPTQVINEIVKGTKQITPTTARELAAALGTSVEFWSNLETAYRLNLAKKHSKEREIERRSRLHSIAPVSEMIKRRWIESGNSLDELEKSVCKFLNIDSPQETPQISVNFRHGKVLEAKYISQVAWCKRVRNVVSQQKVSSFYLKKVKESITDILALSKQEENLKDVPFLLNDLGIYFAIVPHLPKTYLDGATFRLEEGNPVIALTTRYDRIDNFWFTLMHELGHIVADHQGVYLDNMKELEDNPYEREADDLASNWLIHKNDFQAFLASANNKFLKKNILNFAETQNRHPGIILGRLNHEGIVPYGRLSNFLVKVKPHLSDWIYR